MCLLAGFQPNTVKNKEQRKRYVLGSVLSASLPCRPRSAEWDFLRRGLLVLNYENVYGIIYYH